MGMDFNHQAAHAWFLNLDKLVRLLPEAEPGLAVFYSTPACYLAALHGAGLAWPAKQASASKSSIRRFVITEKAPTWAFSWLKAATSAFTFKTLTPQSLNVKLGPRRNYQ